MLPVNFLFLPQVFLLVLALCTFSAAPVFAATLEVQLLQQVDVLERKKSSLETLENRLVSYQESKVEARERLDKALADVVDAKVQLANAGLSEDTEGASQRELAQRSLALAEQGLDNRQNKLNRVEQSLAAIEHSIVEHQDVIARQQSAVVRLNQQLAQQKQQKAQQQTLRNVQATAKPAAEYTVAIAEPEVITSAALAADIANLPAPAAGLPARESSAALTAEQKQARAEMHMLNERTKGADKKLAGRYQALELVIDRKEEIDFEYLGNGQFYAEFPLSADSHRLQIKRRAFSVTISKENANNTYILIYDTLAKGDPRMAFFNKSLLDD